MCLSKKLVTCFLREAQPKSGYKPPLLAYSIRMGFTKNESLGKDSKALKVGRQQLPTKQARKIA